MDNAIEAIFGLKDCELINSETKLKDDKPYQLYSFRYIGDVPDTCANCGNKMYRHGSRSINVTDIPAYHPVKWEITGPRMRCPNCKEIWQPTFSGVDEERKLTSRAVINIAQRSIRDTFETVGEDYLLSGNTVKNIFSDFLNTNASKMRFKTPAFIGIDEIKVKKLGELTVITDLEHRTMFDILKERNQKTLIEYFMSLNNREDVLWVCSDMYRPFQKAIGTALPNARWVIDHFHVVMKANEAVDDVRRKVQDGMTKKDRISTKRGLAYTLKTRLKDLTAEEASTLRKARNDPQTQPLMTAFDLKEDFFNIYDENMSSKDNAIEAFNKWEESIPEDELYDKFRELAKTVHNFHEQIFNYWDCPITISNGFTECSNRIIREKNLRGRGYSFDVLRARTLYRKTNIKRLLEQNLLLIGPAIPEEGCVFFFDGAGAEMDGVYFEPATGEISD